MHRTALAFSPFRRVIAGLVLVHLLAVLALAASPRLHHWVHPDEDDDDGDCAVVLFLHGAAGGVAPGLLTVAAFAALLVAIVGAPAAPAFVLSIFARSRVFEHGPPAG